MPNRDTGHYFLTVLAPVRVGSDTSHAWNKSWRQQLMETLARLPNSETVAEPDRHASAAAAAAGPAPAPRGSPFARNTMTHLARFVVIDQPAYNGRWQTDAILGRLGIGDPNPLVHQKLDRLGTSYLLFAADFDAPEPLTDLQSLRAYTDELWRTMSAELLAIFRHCYGFEAVAAAQEAGDATGAAEKFYDYIRHCQVETTMSFNDYWLREPGTGKFEPPPDLFLPPLNGSHIWKGVFGIALAALVASLAAWILMASGSHRTTAMWVFLGLLVALIGYVVLTIMRIMAQGMKPLPSSATLPEVLKSIHLQQKFTGFIIDQQGRSPAELHAAFGSFVAAQRPADVAGPTQPPGVFQTP